MQSPPPAKGAAYTLGLLLVIYVVNHIDRQVMYILAESVKTDLELTDGQLGSAAGERGVGFPAAGSAG